MGAPGLVLDTGWGEGREPRDWSEGQRVAWCLAQSELWAQGSSWLTTDSRDGPGTFSEW